MYKKYCSWKPSPCSGENGRYLKSIANDLKIVCAETIYVMDIVLINVANTISTSVSRNPDGKKVRYKLVVMFCTQFY